jgi:hypothetical protein
MSMSDPTAPFPLKTEQSLKSVVGELELGCPDPASE